MIKIPVMKPRLANFEEIAPLLRSMDQSRIYSNRGPLVRELEEEYSRYFNVNKELVVALANATQAIQGLLSISKNRDWVVPDYTFSATGLAVLTANRRLHICDVNLIDWKIDTNLISEKQKGFGILPVMPFGSGIDFEPYKNFKDVIIDAAASLGAPPPIFSEMRSSWAVVYSLHATKVLGAGEGAIVVCGNHLQADSLRAWSNFGFSSGRASEIQGTNAKMSEMNAVYGLASIKKMCLADCTSKLWGRDTLTMSI
jgi:dTDP-4-amino-4,6-dideoxygalactose transaminase